MIQGDSPRLISPKPKCFSGGQFCLVVEPLDHGAGTLSFCPEPVQQPGSVTSEHLGHLLHWFDLRAHGPGAPFIQKLARPIRRAVRPQKLKHLLQQVASDRLPIVLHQVGQSGPLFFRQILRPLEPQPARLGKHRLVAFRRQCLHLLCADFVNRLAQVCHDVNPVQDVHGLACLLRDHLQIGLSHVRADEIPRLAPPLAEPAKTSQQRLDRTLYPNPQQPFAMGIDLVAPCQVCISGFGQTG